MKEFTCAYVYDKEPNTVDTIFFPESVGLTPGSYFERPDPLNNYLFTYVIAGSFNFSNAANPGEHIVCPKNTLVIYRPGQLFSTSPASPNSIRIWFHAEGELIEKLLVDLEIDEGQFFDFPEGTEFDVLNRFESLHNAFKFGKSNRSTIIRKAIAFLEIFDQRRIANSSLNQYLANTLVYINDNFSSKISIEHLANMCHVTTSYYIIIFKKQYGMTPHQAIMNQRFAKALHYLRYSNLPISEIASLCGFNDRIHFSQSFKKKFGHSPIDERLSPNDKKTNFGGLK